MSHLPGSPSDWNWENGDHLFDEDQKTFIFVLDCLAKRSQVSRFRAGL
jgi:hypothetical protein